MPVARRQSADGVAATFAVYSIAQMFDPVNYGIGFATDYLNWTKGGDERVSGHVAGFRWDLRGGVGCGIVGLFPSTIEG